MSKPVTASRRAASWGFWLGALALLALAWVARLSDFANVFTEEGVELKPTDSHYYARFAQLQREAFPRFVPFDPFINFPDGAPILFPPLHTWTVAASISLTPEEGGAPEPPTASPSGSPRASSSSSPGPDSRGSSAAARDTARAERGAAWVGPVTSLVELLLLLLLARRLGGNGFALGVGALFALLPVSVYAGGLGNADHHVHEPFFAAAVALVQGAALERGSRRLSFAAGLLLGLGRFFTPSAFMLVPLFAAALLFAAWRLGQARARELTVLAVSTGAGCVALLAPGVLLFGDAAALGYERFSWFQPLVAGLFFSAAAAGCELWGARGARRTFWGLALLALALLAVLAPELVRALAALGRRDPLLSLVTESQPLWRHPAWAWSYFGVAVLWLPLALWGLGSKGASAQPFAVRWIPAVTALVGLGLAAALQARFAQAWVGPLALVLAWGLESFFVGARAPRRVALAGAVAVGVSLATYLPQLQSAARASEPTDEALLRPTLEWLSVSTPPVDARRPEYGIVASHDVGHLLALWARRPAVATPFSQAPWHVAGNARAAAVLSAPDDEEAFLRARETGARYVLATPFQRIVGRPVGDDSRTLARRLLETAALENQTAHFRLVHDSAEQRLRRQGGSVARLFEVVEGAVVRGEAPPGAAVVARLRLSRETGEGRESTAALEYTRKAVADASGRFSLRLAYPTVRGGSSGAQGVIRALGPYQLEAGGVVLQRFELSEEDVGLGREIALGEATSRP